MTLPLVSATNERRLPVARSTDIRLARLAVWASFTAWVNRPPAYAALPAISTASTYWSPAPSLRMPHPFTGVDE